MLENYIPLVNNEKLPPVSLEEKFEKSLQDCTQIMSGDIVYGRYYVGNLPVYMVISGDRLFFNNKWFEQTIQNVGVRGDGSDVWEPM